MLSNVRAWRLALATLALPMLLAPPAAAFVQKTSAISANERAQGARAHPQILAQFGGAYAGPQSAYVGQVGRRIAVQSGMGNSQGAYTVTLLNSNAMNAFALPGGYVYVTRQLLAIMNDEAELAFVLGHEVGHVAADHSQKRSTRSTLASLGSVIAGAVTGSSLATDLVGRVGQYAVLGYSRSQEYQADTLGVRYLGGAGYDPLAAPDMLNALGGQTSLEARLKGQAAENATPSWGRTHPLTADRVTRARALAQKTGTAAQRQRNRDAFLNAIDGMAMDDDPRQGVIDGRSFRHPDLRLGFTAPAGYALVNGAEAVTIQGAGGQASFAGGAIGGGLDSYIDTVFRRLGGQTRIDYGRPERTRVNGLDGLVASARASTQSGQVDVTVAAFDWGNGQAYHFVTIAPAGRGVGPFGSLIGSLQRLTPAEAGAIRARRLDVVTVRPGDTIASLSARMAYPDYRSERFLALNALPANAALRPGTRVKLVGYGAAR